MLTNAVTFGPETKDVVIYNQSAKTSIQESIKHTPLLQANVSTTLTILFAAPVISIVELTI